MIELKNVDFYYGNHQILQNININVDRGKMIGLMGENGAGKTTLMKIISGIYQPNKGKVNNGTRRIGTLIESPTIYSNLSVQQNMDFFTKLYGESEKRMEDLMRIMGIWEYRKRNSNKLSLGMKQRLGVAIALLASTDIVLLDEPTNGLDPTGINELLLTIKEISKLKNTTFVISSHILQNLENVCEEYYLIRDKQLFNIYDTKGKCTHYLSCQQNEIENIFELLKRRSIVCKVIDGKICLENITDDRKIMNVLEQMGITIHKRKLQEVYFE